MKNNIIVFIFFISILSLSSKFDITNKSLNFNRNSYLTNKIDKINSTYFTQLKTLIKLKRNPIKIFGKQTQFKKLTKSELFSVEQQDNKKWVDHKCPSLVMVKFVDIKCDVYGIQDKIVFLRSQPTPFIYQFQAQTWNLFLMQGNWVSKKDTSFEFYSTLPRPWQVNEIRVFDFVPLKNMEMIARPDNNIDAPIDWIQIAPVIDVEETDEVQAGTFKNMSDKDEIEAMIKTKKGSMIILLLMLIFFILSMIPFFPPFIRIIFLILFFIFMIIHMWFQAGRFKKDQHIIEQNVNSFLRGMGYKELKFHPRIIQGLKVKVWGRGYQYQGQTAQAHYKTVFNFSPVTVMLRQKYADKDAPEQCIMAPAMIGAYYFGVPCVLGQEQVPQQFRLRMVPYGLEFYDPVLRFTLCLAQSNDEYFRVVNVPCNMCGGRCKLAAKDHFTQQMQHAPDKCLTLDKQIDKRQEDIIEKVSGNSIMLHQQTDACSHNTPNYKIRYDNMLNRGPAVWMSAEQDEFVEVEFKMNLRLPMFIKYMVIMWQQPPLKFNILCMKKFMTSQSLMENQSNNYQRFTLLNFDNSECSKVKIQMQKFNPKMSIWRKRCDGTPMFSYGIKFVKIVKDFGIMRFDNCTNDKKSTKDQILTTNFMETVDIKHDPKVMDAEDVLNKVMTTALENMPLMRSLSNNFLGMINLGFLINRQYLSKRDSGTRKVPVMKMLANSIEKEGGINFDYGASSDKPAQACEQIKMFYPYKPSGFYWLQPLCRGQAFRAYCMFENGQSNSVFFSTVNEITNGDIKRSLFEDVSWLENTCSYLGLNWNQFSVRKLKHLKTLIALLKQEGQDLSGRLTVPLAQDGSCSSNPKCGGNFTSIGNADRAGNKVQDKFFEQLGVPPLPTEEDSGIKLDLMGISHNTIVKSNLAITPLLGLACSTNYTTVTYAKALCDTPLYKVEGVQLNPNYNFQLICPSDCEFQDAKVFGYRVQHTNSSACKAAMQMDAFNEQMNGLIANVTILSGSGFQKGDYANGILSEDLAEFSTQAFSPEIVKCPSKDFANRSFIQVENEVKFKSKIQIQNLLKTNLGIKIKNMKSSEKGIVKLDTQLNYNSDKTEHIRKKENPNQNTKNVNDIENKDSFHPDASKDDSEQTNSRKSTNQNSPINNNNIGNNSNTNQNNNTNTNSDNDQNNYLDNLNTQNSNLTPIELMNNIKGFKHKIELKKQKKKVKEELATWFKATLDSLEVLHDEQIDSHKKHVELDDDTKFTSPFMKLDAFKSFKEAHNISNFNDLIQFINTPSKDTINEFEEFKDLKLDDLDKKYLTKDLMGFTNVFIADIKNKIIDFAQEEMEVDKNNLNSDGHDSKDHNYKVNDSNEFNVDFDKVADEYHMNQKTHESLSNFKQRVKNYYKSALLSNPELKYRFITPKQPSEFAGGNEHFFGPDPTEQITYLNPSRQPDIISKKTRMMMRHGELFFNTMTAQMKILNGITLSQISTADFNYTMHSKTQSRVAPILSFYAAISNKIKSMLIKAESILKSNFVILQDQVPMLNKFTTHRGRYEVDVTGEHLIPAEQVVQDNKKQVNGPSKWQVTNKNTSPHPIALTNLSDITNYEGTSSMIMHRYQTCFDCIVGYSVNVNTDDAIINFMQKFIDLENYAAVQYNYVQRSKTIYKKVFGMKQIMSQEDDIENMPVGWFRFVVNMEQFKYTFQEEKEEGNQRQNEDFNKVDKMIVKFGKPMSVIYDSSFSSGKVVFACGSCAGIMLDFLKIKHKLCNTKESMSNLKIIAPIVGRWSLKGKNQMEFEDAFLFNDFKANKRSQWKLIVKAMGYDSQIFEKKTVFNKIKTEPASMFILSNKSICKDQCTLRIKRLAHNKCFGSYQYIKYQDQQNQIAFREYYGMIEKHDDFKFVREIQLKLKGFEQTLFKSTADFENRYAAERNMTIASFLPRQFEINITGNSIKLFNQIGIEENKSVFFDSADTIQDTERNFKYLKYVGKLKGPFAIGVNKCSAQFADIQFGPVKEERKVHEMEKGVEFAEDEDEFSGMTNDEVMSAKAKLRQSLSDNAATYKNQVDNLFKYSLFQRQQKSKDIVNANTCLHKTDSANINQFCEERFLDKSDECKMDQCKFCCDFYIPKYKSSFTCRRTCMQRNLWFQEIIDYKKCQNKLIGEFDRNLRTTVSHDTLQRNTNIEQFNVVQSDCNNCCSSEFGNNLNSIDMCKRHCDAFDAEYYI